MIKKDPPTNVTDKEKCNKVIRNETSFSTVEILNTKGEIKKNDIFGSSNPLKPEFSGTWENNNNIENNNKWEMFRTEGIKMDIDILKGNKSKYKADEIFHDVYEKIWSPSTLIPGLSGGMNGNLTASTATAPVTVTVTVIVQK